jgi:hypothetical protein
MSAFDQLLEQPLVALRIALRFVGQPRYLDDKRFVAHHVN